MGPQSWKTSSSAFLHPPASALGWALSKAAQPGPASLCGRTALGARQGWPGESDQTQHQENLVLAWALFPTYWMTLEKMLFPAPHLSNE